MDGAPSLGKGEIILIALEWFLTNLAPLVEEFAHLPPIVESHLLGTAKEIG
jgi:hypothetical protein